MNTCAIQLSGRATQDGGRGQAGTRKVGGRLGRQPGEVCVTEVTEEKERERERWVNLKYTLRIKLIGPITTTGWL